MAHRNPAAQMNSYILGLIAGLGLFGVSMLLEGVTILLSGSQDGMVATVVDTGRLLTIAGAVILVLGASIKYRSVHSSQLWFNENSDEYFAVMLRKAMARAWQLGILLFLGLEIATKYLGASVDTAALIYFASGINFLLVVVNFLILVYADLADDAAEHP